MAEPSEDQTRLWGVIVAYGMENLYERDWLGRIRSKRTKGYIKAEITPELAQALAGASAQLAGAAATAKSALASAPRNVRQLLSNLRETPTPH